MQTTNMEMLNCRISILCESHSRFYDHMSKGTESLFISVFWPNLLLWEVPCNDCLLPRLSMGHRTVNSGKSESFGSKVFNFSPQAPGSIRARLFPLNSIGSYWNMFHWNSIRTSFRHNEPIHRFNPF